MQKSELKINKGNNECLLVNYLFRRPLNSSDFLYLIVTSNFCTDKRFNTCCFRIDDSVVLSTKKGKGKALRPTIFGKWTKSPNKLDNTQVPLESLNG